MASACRATRRVSRAEARRNHRDENSELRKLEPAHSRNEMVRIPHSGALQLFHSAHAHRDSPQSWIRAARAAAARPPTDQRFTVDGGSQARLIACHVSE